LRTKAAIALVCQNPPFNATVCRRPASAFIRKANFVNPGAPTGEWRYRWVLRFLKHTASTVKMPASPQDLFAFLDRLSIRHCTVTHPPLFTVADSQSLRGQIAGGHTKNLFLKDRAGSLYLIVADEDAAIDLKSIHHRIGTKRVSFGSADLLMRHLGVLPGSVTPFAAINDTAAAVSLVLDAAMMAHDVLNFHPLVNTMTTSIAAADLVTFLKATGHEPHILEVSDTPSAGARAH
jgi:Ala-tRNA(Pro) deacylase